MEKNRNQSILEIRKNLNTIIHILDTNKILRDNLATNPEYKIVIDSLKYYIEEAYKADLKDIQYKQ